jgi:hypothetical protein
MTGRENAAKLLLRGEYFFSSWNERRGAGLHNK